MLVDCAIIYDVLAVLYSLWKISCQSIFPIVLYWFLVCVCVYSFTSCFFRLSVFYTSPWTQNIFEHKTYFTPVHKTYFTKHSFSRFPGEPFLILVLYFSDLCSYCISCFHLSDLCSVLLLFILRRQGLFFFSRGFNFWNVPGILFDLRYNYVNNIW